MKYFFYVLYKYSEYTNTSSSSSTYATLRCAYALRSFFASSTLRKTSRKNSRARVRVINVQNMTCKSIEWDELRAIGTKYNFYVMFWIFYVNNTCAKHHQVSQEDNHCSCVCSSMRKTWNARVSDGTNRPSSKFYLLFCLYCVMHFSFHPHNMSAFFISSFFFLWNNTSEYEWYMIGPWQSSTQKATQYHARPFERLHPMNASLWRQCAAFSKRFETL